MPKGRLCTDYALLSIDYIARKENPFKLLDYLAACGVAEVRGNRTHRPED